MTATTTRLTSRGAARKHGPWEAELKMRRDGFVTAVEVAQAMGVTLPTVIRNIQHEHLPGKSVQAAASMRKRWYVDIRRLLAQYPRDGSSEVRQALQRLARLVG